MSKLAEAKQWLHDFHESSSSHSEWLMSPKKCPDSAGGSVAKSPHWPGVPTFTGFGGDGGAIRFLGGASVAVHIGTQHTCKSSASSKKP